MDGLLGTQNARSSGINPGEKTARIPEEREWERKRR